ncbi:MAG: hypothetical protein FWD95_08465 [Nocardioidaceae bacterium]|nr:hypothetical protein [Microbacteriaceae bacterium]MCL2613252.1 hypothetical protein [Nocardioidaceae bacterium]
MSLFLEPQSLAFTDELTDAAVRLLATTGVPRLSLGLVAAGMGMSRQGLTQRLKTELEAARHESAPAAYLHEIVAGRFGTRFCAWSTDGLFDDGTGRPPRLAVPVTEEERTGTRIWHTLREIARADRADGETGPARALAMTNHGLRRETRTALERWSGRRLSLAEVCAILALVDGVHIAASAPIAPIAPIAPAIARKILDDAILALAARAAGDSAPAA